jgi:hypothetical protein
VLVISVEKPRVEKIDQGAIIKYGQLSISMDHVKEIMMNGMDNAQLRVFCNYVMLTCRIRCNNTSMFFPRTALEQESH